VLTFPSSRTSSVLRRELGWKPEKTGQDFKNTFLEEAKVILGDKALQGGGASYAD
jgi:hypothetical protein